MVALPRSSRYREASVVDIRPRVIRGGVLRSGSVRRVLGSVRTIVFLTPFFASSDCINRATKQYRHDSQGYLWIVEMEGIGSKPKPTQRKNQGKQTSDYLDAETIL